jgi:GTP-binding protein YchF
MNLRVGIVGLPNVGKSTLFNALTKQAVQARNVPFTTIEPNVGIVPVPDERLEKLSAISKSAKITPTTIEFVDIAGLVKDAHAGQGLGNKFLSHIHQVDAIAHVVRFFDDPNIIHVANAVNPESDAEIINTELALADLQLVERALGAAKDKAKNNDKEAVARATALERLYNHLSAGKPARELPLTSEEDALIKDIPLLTRKPMLYVANVSESQIKGDPLLAEFTQQYQPVLPLSIKIEQELVELPEDEQQTFLAEYELTQTGLHRLIQESYKLLELVTFFTSGPTESRAWTVQRGAHAPQAAGKVHSDMEHGFIRAETVAYEDLLKAGSYAAARAAGKVRDEGKNYIVKDGDIMLFKFSPPA